MKRLLCLLTLLGWAAWANAGLPTYYTAVSATQTNSTVTVDLDESNDEAWTVTLVNDGPFTAFYDLADGTATTSNMEIKVGESHTIRTKPGTGIRTLGIICNTGQTATVRVFAFPTR